MKSRLDIVLEKVHKKINPSYWERKETSSVLEMVKKATGNAIKKKNLTYVLAGSYVRDTWLTDKKEFDIFILFPENVKRSELEKKGLAYGKKIVKILKGKFTIAYAEHPYIRAVIKGYAVDIVPAYKVKSGREIKSAVDRTPFHNNWLAEHLALTQVPEVRLLKQFCKAQGIYGSDTKTMGLSGYLIELLIIHYNGFKNFLKGASEWEAGNTFLDIADYYRDRPKERMEANKRFKGHPLVVIDPVDPDRNVAAALSPSNFIKLSWASRNLMENPSVRMFSKDIPKANARKIGAVIKKRETQFIGIQFKQPVIIDDVLWPQLRKAAKRLRNELEDYEFKVMGSDVFSDGHTSVVLMELETWNMPAVRNIRGPPIFALTNSKQFLDKYKKGRVWVEEDFWKAEIQRKYRTAELLLKDYLKGNAKKLHSYGMPTHIAKALSNQYKILKNNDLGALSIKNKGFALFLQEWIERDMI